MKRFRKIISVLCIFAIVLSTAAAFPVAAADTAVISANDTTVYKGSSFWLDINAENISDVGTMEIAVYYDSAVLTLQGIHNRYLVDGCLLSTNGNIIGVASMSILSTEGLSGSGTMFALEFSVKPNCTADATAVTVTVGDAYNTQLKEVSVQSRSANLTIKDSIPQPDIFYLSASPSVQSVATDKSVTVEVWNMYNHPFVSGDFTFEYDRDLFSVEAVALSAEMQTPDAVYSVNTKIDGCVIISYIAPREAYRNNLFSITLKAKHTAPAQTVLRVSCSEVYKNNQVQYANHSFSTKLTLTAQQEQSSVPALYTVTDGIACEGQSLTTQLCLDAGSGLAAGDFTLPYDTSVLECESVTVSDAVAEDNGIITLNPNYKNGTIRFSYVHTQGTQAALTLLHITWKVRENTSRHYTLIPSGKGVVDAVFKPLKLQYKTEDDCVTKKVTVAPDCTKAGGEYAVCTQKETSDILLPADTYPESGHPYASNADEWYSFSSPGAQSLVLHFNEQTAFEGHCDWLYVYDSNGNLVGAYTNNQLAGSAITVHSDTVTLQLTSDGSVEHYGFRIDRVYAKGKPCTAEDVLLKELPQLAHNMQAGTVVAPTCTADGYTVYTCTNGCQMTENRDFVAASHHLVSVNAQNPTCTEVGWNAYEYCTACTYSTYAELGIDAENHTNTTIVAAVPPTDSQAGYTEGTFCNDCETFISGHEMIPALQPSFTDSENAKRIGDFIFANNGLTASSLLAQASDGSMLPDENDNGVAPERAIFTGARLRLSDNTDCTVVVLGDVDCDGLVTASDARLALRASVRLENFPTDSVQYKASNVSSEDPVSAGDARSILRVSVKLDDPQSWLQSLPIG